MYLRKNKQNIKKLVILRTKLLEHISSLVNYSISIHVFSIFYNSFVLS